MRIFAAALVFATTALAGLVTRQTTVPTPQVTYPHDRNIAVWVSGWRHNVTWANAGLSGNGGTIYLAKAGVVDTGHPLASGFPLEAGRVEVVTPFVPPGADYTVLLEINGQSASSAPFIISRSKENLPAYTPAESGVTTVVFPSTTIVATVTGPVASATAPPASSVVSSMSEEVSSALSSASVEASSIFSSISSVQSSVSRSASSAASAATSSPSPSESGAGNAATSLTSDLTAVKALVAVGAIALSAGALSIF